jgi:hypothetical protein
MPNEACRQAEELLSRNHSEALSSAEQQALSLHLAQCPSCTEWANIRQGLRQAIQQKSAELSLSQMATMKSVFLAAPTPTPIFFFQPKVLGALAFAATAAALFWIAPLFTESKPTTAVGVQLGPHQGFVQEKNGVRVELVVKPSGEVQVYLFDSLGTPQLATKPVQMMVSAPGFAQATSTLQPSPDQLFLVGKLPAVQGEVDLSVPFPSGDTFVFPKIQGPPQSTPVQVTTKGGSAQLGNSKIEAEILPKGEVRVKAFGEDGAPLPADSFSVPELTVEHKGKPYPVKLSKKPSSTYWSGTISNQVQIDAGAEVKILCNAPVVIQEITYQPTVIVFAPYVVVVPVKVVPVIIIKKSYKHSHKHGKGHKHSHSNR